ncbi:glutamate racemase [Massilia sp. CFBP9026]|uniref:glutamate racemase n=1 Tax=Massilia sp. CFBP9026 TaxID=3096536 RepID=UPI002A6AFF92|nr:glutamate racemase [Massilia sp. CFBP9026]MDY0965446.1 glutamate racemase [Massilia sp. CFBP9026]
MTLPDAPVGIFDSGVGGLSVLRHIQAQLPHEHLLYLADTGFAPYGDKPEAIVVERVLAIGDFLLAQGAKALVVACNTATVAAVRELRAVHPGLPIVGVEPGLKPAAALTRTGKVGVLATERTLRGAKFLQLRDQVHLDSGAEFLLQPCVGLADQIEFGELDSTATSAMLERFIMPLLTQGADTLVLGCTHYPLVRSSIERLLKNAGRPDVALVDTGDAVARQLARLLVAGELLRAPGTLPASLTGYTSASATALTAAFRSLLGIDPPVHEAQIAVPRDWQSGRTI